MLAPLALVVLALASPAAAAPCKYGRIAELPVTMRGLVPMTPARINGVEAQFVLDSGAFFSSLTEAAADRMKVAWLPGAGMQIRGLGGMERASVGRVREFVFAGQPLTDVQFIVIPTRLGGDAAGLLGQNVLGAADVEYDLANGAVRMLKPLGDCAATDLGYWAPGRTNVLALEKTEALSSHTIGQAQVNGRKIRVLFDTGAATSFLSPSAARAAGLRLDAAGAKAGGVSAGIGSALSESTLAPVESFSLGGETIRNTQLRIGSRDLGLADMLLGADFFLSHRVLVAKSQRRLYFTYNGGAVFRLDQQPSAAPAVAGVSAEAAGADADALGRRAAAAAARRDFGAAVAALDRAVALDPKAAPRLVERARAKAAAKDFPGALADYDRALELAPGDAHARLGRGLARLAVHEPALARPDIEAALAAAPDDQQVVLGAAGGYVAAGEYGEAVALYDRWIDSHRGQERSWTLLNSRCFTRALWGRELDKARADCDAALRFGGRSSAVLDSRGLVNLRAGRLKEAVADYDAALKLQPRLAWALYGRGWARRALGDAPGGDADMRAAVALDPDLPKLVARVGLDRAAPAAAHVQ